MDETEERSVGRDLLNINAINYSFVKIFVFNFGTTNAINYFFCQNIYAFSFIFIVLFLRNKVDIKSITGLTSASRNVYVMVLAKNSNLPFFLLI